MKLKTLLAALLTITSIISASPDGVSPDDIAGLCGFMFGSSIAASTSNDESIQDLARSGAILSTVSFVASCVMHRKLRAEETFYGIVVGFIIGATIRILKSRHYKAPSKEKE